MKKYDRAVSDFTEFIKMKPRSVDAFCNRGNAYFNQGKRNFALRDYNTALGMDPNDAEIYYNRALVQLDKGNQSSATVDFRRAADLGLPQASEYLKPPAAKPPAAKPKPAIKAASKNSSKTPIKTAKQIPSKTPPKETIKAPPKTSTSVQTVALKNEKLSAGSASGKIHGKIFKVEEAGMANGILTLRQGSDFFPDYAVLIFLFLKEGEQADGRTFQITKSQGFGSPHIHMKYKQKDQNTPKTEIFMKDYTMRLEFGKREKGSLPGKIFLSLPDKNQSFVNGTFFAEIK
jgi:tetratricopeptide (TPR) repeat protein